MYNNIILGIFYICVIILIIDKIRPKKKAIEKFTDDSLNQSIENLSTIASNMMLIDGFKIPSSSNAVPIGTIIMWVNSNPPFPNVANYIEGQTYNFNPDTDCWVPCDGNTYNKMITPDLLGRIPIGTSNNSPYSQSITKLSKLGGTVPVGQHSHSVSSAGNHSHPIEQDKSEDGWAKNGDTSLRASDRTPEGTFNTNVAGNHTHSISTEGQHLYTIDKIPYATAVQFWMRVL